MMIFGCRNDAFIGEFSEADAAEIEVAHIAVLSSATEATANDARLEFGVFFDLL